MVSRNRDAPEGGFDAILQAAVCKVSSQSLRTGYFAASLSLSFFDSFNSIYKQQACPARFNEKRECLETSDILFLFFFFFFALLCCLSFLRRYTGVLALKGTLILPDIIGCKNICFGMKGTITACMRERGCVVYTEWKRTAFSIYPLWVISGPVLVCETSEILCLVLNSQFLSECPVFGY